MERRIGVSTCAMQRFFGNRAAIEMAARTGATAIDLDLGIPKINFLTERLTIESELSEDNTLSVARAAAKAFSPDVFMRFERDILICM